MIVNTWSGDPLDFHALEPIDLMVSSEQISVWLVRADRPAIALGSAQRHLLVAPPEVVGRPDAATIAVGARRSGGGAVLIDPGRSTWIDVLLPVGNRNWDDDVIRSGQTIGMLLGAAVAEATGQNCDVVRSSAMDRLGTQVCFAGLGPGEVTVGGRKLIGVSQRRVRAGARFQIIWYSEHRTRLLLDRIDALGGRESPLGSKFLLTGQRALDEVGFEIDQRLTTLAVDDDVLPDCLLGHLDRLDGSEHLRG